MNKEFTQNHISKQTVISAVCLIACFMFSMGASAQLSKNKDKFLGNITTRYNVDYGNEKFYQLWNQITPENESKWGSIEGNARGQFNWGSDASYNYAKSHKFPFKFHTFIWGGQYPNWMNNLSQTEQYKAIVEWLDAVKKHYPNLDMIDVVNEAIPGHAPAPYKNALGGDGASGYDWIIKAFELASERWPNAILIYNDYNTFRWQKSEYINLCRILRDWGAPIDAYGCQSHDCTDMEFSEFKSAMEEIQRELKMPMVSSEYDIGTYDDDLQKKRFSEQIPYMWEADYCAGITLWGYIYGATWTENGNSGIIKEQNGKWVDRPAMTWLREYMKTDAALNAKSPFPGMKKEASFYIKPSSMTGTKGEVLPINVTARLRTKTVDHIDMYVNNKLVETLTESPYVFNYTPATTGKHSVKGVLVATDGTQWERLSSFTAYGPRAPYKDEIAIPGTLQAENFDSGAEGVAYHDTSSNNEGGVNYRKDDTGVDITTCTSGYAISNTVTGEWVEYTCNVEEAGLYSIDAYVSSGVTTAAFNIELNTPDGRKDITGTLAVPCAQANSWSTYKVVHSRLLQPLEAGTQRLRINAVSGNFNIDKVIFRKVDLDDDIDISITTDPATVQYNTTVTIIADVTAGSSPIKNVKFYVNNVLSRTVSSEPYQSNYRPTSPGTYLISAEATTEDGKVSKLVSKNLKVTAKRTPYAGVIELPGILQAENFDKGSEGFTYHDSDTQDEGKAGYRSDNGGLDIVTGNGGYALGYTAAGEWTEYTINVTDPGKYSYEATVSSGVSNSGFSIGLVGDDDQITTLAKITVPKTGDNDWETYKVVKGNLSQYLTAGQQILRITITGTQCNIDKIKFNCTLSTDISDIEVEAQPVKSTRFSNETYNLAGQKVGADYKGIVIKNGKKILVK